MGVTDTIEGARYVKHRPRVFALLMVKPAWGMGGGILTLLAVFGERVFPIAGKTATSIGVLFAARGIGTAVGPIVARRWAGETRRSAQGIFVRIGFGSRNENAALENIRTAATIWARRGLPARTSRKAWR